MSEVEEDFWLSDEGILVRLEDLSHQFTFQTYNGALKGSFKEAGVQELVWVADYTGGNEPCPYCDSQNGRIYSISQFLPRVPAHIKCKCFWDMRIRLGEV